MNWNGWVDGLWWLYDFADRAIVARASRAQLQAIQQRRFRRVVRRAYHSSAYYRALMSVRKIDPETCQVADFPEMTKQDLLDHFDEIVTDRRLSLEKVRAFVEGNDDPTALLEDRYYVVRTTGSSRQVGYVAYTAREWIRGCSHKLRFAPEMRWRKRSAWVGCAGHYAGATLGMTGQRGINRLFYNCRLFDVGRPLADLVKGLNEFRPHLLSSYAANLSLLAREHRAGRLQIAPQRIVNSGEPLSGELRRLLEETFQAPVSNLYSATETLFMGAAVNGSDGMGLFEDDLIFEVFDDYVCVTNLFNRTTPLIRYRLDDSLVLQSTGAPATPFRRVREIVGRSERMLRFRNNRGQLESVHPLSILVLDLPGVPFFQLRQLNEQEFVFRVQLCAGGSDAERDDALRNTRARLTELLAAKQLERSVSFRLEVVTAFEMDKNRCKFKVIEYADEVPPASPTAA